MQILQWLLKGEHEQERESSTFNPPTQNEATNDKNAKGKDVIILMQHHVESRRTKRIEGTKLDHKKLKLFAFSFICGKDNIPKTCYYNLNRIENLNRRRKHFVHSLGSAKKADSGNRVGNKVLPISEASFSTSTEGNNQCGTRKTEYQAKGNKRGKFDEQKVLQYPRRGTIKAVPDDDQLSSESPKISFTLDEESGSITSLYSAISIAPLSNNGQAQIAHSPIYIPPKESDHMICREGIWITTEDFVVLEL